MNLAVLFALASIAQSSAMLPIAVQPTPSPRQLAWQKLDYYAFVHFGPNTFTGNEWGQGTEDPNVFNPTRLDCRQWARSFKEAGMKAIILTAKHHDGFCLWPSNYSEHTVAQSRWRNGNGDVLLELSRACKEFGLKFGVYLSPWDRNHSAYGTPEYNDVFKSMLREVLTQYGPVHEVWFDGANGEGPNGKRQVYDWPGFVATVRKYAPDAVIFSDVGPDIRWVGNESGYAGETNWSMLSTSGFEPGSNGPPQKDLNEGRIDGARWIPAECDVTIRPGWFWRESENEKVKSLDHLLDIYHRSVGRNGSLLLNVPPDTRGLIHENDARRLREFKRAVEAIFDADLAPGRPVWASSVRGAKTPPRNITDGSPDTHWAAKDGAQTVTLSLDFGRPTQLNRVVLHEPIELGQRIAKFTIFAAEGRSRTEIARGTTVGNRRILKVPTFTAERLIVRIDDSRAAPALSSIEAYCAPPEVRIVAESRDFLSSATVRLVADQERVEIRYTLDGSEPNRKSQRYNGPFDLARTCTRSAVGFGNGRRSIATSRADFRRYREQDLLRPIVFIRAPDPGLRYEYFERGWQSLVDMAKSEPSAEGVAPNFGLGTRRREEHFGFRFSGVVEVPRDGIYTFSVSSDDGSRLYLHDRLVIDHDGLHGMEERSGTIGLRAGYHPIRVEYFNATGGLGLEVRWSGPGLASAPIPPSRLRH